MSTTDPATSIATGTVTPPKKGTLYNVYSASDPDLTLIQGGVVAANDLAAIRSVANLTDGASYLAIPSRFLRVRTVKVENDPKVVIS